MGQVPLEKPNWYLFVLVMLKKPNWSYDPLNIIESRSMPILPTMAYLSKIL